MSCRRHRRQRFVGRLGPSHITILYFHTFALSCRPPALPSPLKSPSIRTMVLLVPDLSCSRSNALTLGLGLPITLRPDYRPLGFYIRLSTMTFCGLIQICSRRYQQLTLAPPQRSGANISWLSQLTSITLILERQFCIRLILPMSMI